MTKSSSPPTAGDEHASSARGDWRARLVLALQSGAASRDIRDSGAGHFSGRSAASEAFLRRELGRVEAHQKGFVRLLEARVPAPVDSILDVGCSSGSGAIALALSPRLRAQRVVGVDPDASAITAARIRSEGYPSARVAFQSIATNEALPFDDGTFDLTTLVSVLEFVSTKHARRELLGELLRVTKPGGHVFVSTPSRYRLREKHSGRWLGSFRRRAGFPWSSSPFEIDRVFAGCTRIAVRTGLLRPLGWIEPWYKVLYRKPPATGSWR